PAMAAADTAAEGERFGKLVGTWLISAEYYDIWAERGIEIAAYPVLKISADGKIALYRLRGLCWADGPHGKPYPADSKDRIIQCAAARERAAKEGLEVAPATISASGAIQLIEGNRLRFISEEKSPVPSEWAQIYRQLLEKNAFANQAVAKKYETFHSTFYVLDGRPAAAERNGDILKLSDLASDQVFEFRAVRAEALDAAMTFVIYFSLTPSEYFRCLVKRFDTAFSQAASQRQPELLQVAVLAKRAVMLQYRLDLTDAYETQGRVSKE